MDNDTNDDDCGFDSISAAMANEEKERARLANKPIIDHLDDAFEGTGKDRTFVVPRGEKVIVERVATVLSGTPWLDTKVYTVISIDGVTGNVTLRDEEAEHNTLVNYLVGPERGYKFKIPPGRKAISLARKRGRPKKNKVVGAPESSKPIVVGPDGQPIKKRRGRPAGSKNRTRDVIMAEKAAKVEKRRDRKTSKKSR